MTLEVWLLFALISLAPVVSPGPGILFAISNALRHGPRVTILVGLANALGITLLGLAVGFGLGAIMAASQAGFLILKLVGAAYLIYLGVKIWRDRAAFVVASQASGSKPPVRRLIGHALAISLTNPKAAIALAALFPPFMVASAPAGPQIVIMAVTYGALCAVNHVLIAFAGGWLRRFLSSARRVSWVRRITGGTFIGFGAALVASR